MIHGCMDGYSRRIIYLHASDNNRSNTRCSLMQLRKAVFQNVYELTEVVRMWKLLVIC